MVLSGFALVFASFGAVPPHEPNKPRDEWDPYSIRQVCLNSEFFGAVEYRGLVEQDGEQHCRFQVIETLFGEAGKKEIVVPRQDKIYGLGLIVYLDAKDAVGQRYLAAFEQGRAGAGEFGYAMTYRRIDKLADYRKAVAMWNKIPAKPDKMRHLWEFEWLAALMLMRGLREDVLAEFAPPGYTRHIPEGTFGKFDALLKVQPRAYWQQLAQDLDYAGSYSAGKAWALWHFAQPRDALIWLRTVPGRNPDEWQGRWHSKAEGFWSPIERALPESEAKRLGSAVYQVRDLFRPVQRKAPLPEPDPDELAAAVARLQQVVNELELPEAEANESQESVQSDKAKQQAH